VERVSADYLIVGAGAAGLAFADEIVARASANIVIVDRRSVAGGHWNDAYPFVRLHQPAAFYGVNSRVLGSNRIETDGLNEGMYELARGDEVTRYFHQVLDSLLASGRVRVLLGHDYRGDYTTHHVLVDGAGRATRVEATKRVVDARFNQPAIPATHARTFGVDAQASVVTPSQLDGLDAGRYCVLGAGKTAMDVCTHLIASGVTPDAIRWVRPRDPWVLNRRMLQPLDLIGNFAEGLARNAEALVGARDVADLLCRLEESEILMRLDPTVTPTSYRCATLSDAEVSSLRRIENVVRCGHVRRVGTSHLDGDGARITLAPREVVVDATADGLVTPSSRPVFEGSRVTLEQVRGCQPTFNAALIGFVETLATSDEERNALCRPNPYPRSPVDWLSMWSLDSRNEAKWSHNGDVAQWLASSRLNATAALAVHANEPATRAALERFLAAIKPASDRAKTLLAAS
jgi:hypothetical protein